MKKRILALLLCLSLGVFSGCGAQQKPPEPTQAPKTSTGVGFYFDTVVTLTLYGAPEGLIEEIWAACERYEKLLSRTVKGSDVDRINHSGGQPVQVDAETWQILSRAREISRLSGGAFSVTVAPLTTQWDFTGGSNEIPPAKSLQAALPLVDDEKLLLGEGNTVTLPDGMAIDLGGIAKGYIADRVAEMIRGRVSGALLNFGGNVYAVGRKPDGSDYGLGIQDPMGSTGSPLASVRGTDVSIVTSGVYERCFFVGDVRYHHILDPKTGMPARSDLTSATLLHESSMDADAFATACIVLGSEKAMELLDSQGLCGVLITDGGEILQSRAMKENYQLNLIGQ